MTPEERLSEITFYILEECGGLSWWWLSKKWKRIHAEHMARIIYLIVTDNPAPKEVK